MQEKLRYYVAFNGGLKLMQGRSGPMNTVAEFFAGQTVDHLTGCRERPGVVFAAVAHNGGYRTQDGGRTWEKVVEGDVRTFTVDPHDERVVYAGLGPVRLLRSEDCGSAWEPLDGLLRVSDQVKSKWSVPERYRGIQFPHVRCIFIHPDDSRLLFVLLEHGGVLISKDRGETWEDVSSGISYLDMHSLNNYPGSQDRYYVSSARGFFRSDDSGSHWRRVETGMPWAYTELYSYSHDWQFLPGNPPRMMLSGAKGSPGVWSREKRDPEGYILLSDDAGESWRRAAGGLPQRMPWMPWALVPHPHDPNTVFAAMGDGSRGFGFNPKERGNGALYVTRDRGDSWEPVIPEMPAILTAWVAAE
ncbi:MAG: hypothetical protein HY695_11530 [Deltaproteobacteria bacterium]|nr:hypothetical protein [Deltaproteobacteria bacterium]